MVVVVVRDEGGVDARELIRAEPGPGVARDDARDARAERGWISTDVPAPCTRKLACPSQVTRSPSGEGAAGAPRPASPPEPVPAPENDVAGRRGGPAPSSAARRPVEAGPDPSRFVKRKVSAMRRQANVRSPMRTWKLVKLCAVLG